MLGRQSTAPLLKLGPTCPSPCVCIQLCQEKGLERSVCVIEKGAEVGERLTRLLARPVCLALGPSRRLLLCTDTRPLHLLPHAR